MQYSVLGKTGLKISRLGFGGIPIQRIDAEGTKVLMKGLAAAGINYVDTARGYTVSEEYIGYGLEGMREKFVIATKSGAVTKEDMARDVQISLKNLRTDYIDLYQIHNPTAANFEKILAPGGALEALLEAKVAGKIGHIGFTTHSLELLEKVLDMPWVETVMFPYNFVETQIEPLLDKIASRNIGFIVMKPLAGGAIEDASLAIRFACANPNVSVVIPGMAAPQELAQNLEAFEDKTPLSNEEWNRIETLRKELGTQFCRRCNYCAPCTKGIEIPAVFLLEGYLSRYGLTDWAKARYAGLGHKASECIGCGACEPRCPYGLPIRDMLKRAAQRFGS